MKDHRLSRRQLLRGALAGIAAAPAAALVARNAAAAEPLAESDPTAKSLGYVADAKKVDPKANPNYKPGQVCANCMQYTGKAGAAQGPCNIFPGKDVKAAGWCKVWVLKPGAKVG
jgi:High potential iron-sulfur protein